MFIFDTIVAEATAPFESALSIVRLSGTKTNEILERLTEKSVDQFKPRMTYNRNIYTVDHKKIDNAVIVYFEKGKSFTGEESAEFYVHGSRIIVNELIDTIITLGARRAEGGEFTAKAYYNGRMSLVEAEAINEIIKAKTTKGKDLALKTLSGENREKIENIRTELLDIMARIEVDIDYPEYDDEEAIFEKLKIDLPIISQKVKSLCADSKSALYYLTGIKVALVGRPNVGKSTILNSLLGYDKAIVTNIPGTTRDVVEGEKNINGVLYKFFDTAGIRDNPDPIEKIGIEKSHDTIKDADIILYIYDKFDEEEYKDILIESNDKPVVKVQNKNDINSVDKENDISISATSKKVNVIYEIINKRLDIRETVEGGFASKRDLDLLDSFSKQLSEAVFNIEEGMTIDVIETMLLNSTHKLDELLGNNQTMEDLYSLVFAKFCVGK
ncbi:MAG TPA: tRNA uridine-5-carboxymethylaminomethyl(34) synthesis GTPase MnmE [Firmicutes bacterium]|nr:tRNA uridine-5-carboxymethylaminomethyl(34) synthesis GTPase MnmE [Bacillota bacterium]HAW99752.1 tRNA uridine-5-carboxymethylaminomethyl(34) synthesis GTPase MnmE [Bacillota bacterium]